MKLNIPQQMQSRSVLLKNMFNPEEYVYALCNPSHTNFNVVLVLQ